MSQKTSSNQNVNRQYQPASEPHEQAESKGQMLMPPPLQFSIPNPIPPPHFSTSVGTAFQMKTNSNPSSGFVLQRQEPPSVDNSSSPTNEQLGEVGECNTSDLELETFLNTAVFGPQNLAPPTGGGGAGFGGFEATYTHAGGAGVLQIAVRGKVNLVNGLEFDGTTVTAGDPEFDELAAFMNTHLTPVQMGQIIPYYQYTPDEKAEGLVTFQERLTEAMEIWNSAPYSFYVHKPCWEDVSANLAVDVQVSEGDAQYAPGVANEATNDHLQITVIKEPSPGLQDTIQNQIQEYAQMSVDFDTVNTSVRAFVAPGDDQNPFDTSMTLSNNDLDWSQSGDPTEGHLFYQVFFEHDSADLDSDSTGSLDDFIATFEDSANNAITNPVQLIGHASAVGSTAYNEGLVERRMNEVKAYLHDNGFQNVTTRVASDNQADAAAEADPDSSLYESYYRRVDIIVGTGEMQNVLAHELGHVFGLDDEYIEDRGSGTRDLGQATDHDDLAGGIGANPSVFEHNDSLMSLGNEVRSLHFATFGWALKEITNVPDWKIRGG